MALPDMSIPSDVASAIILGVIFLCLGVPLFLRKEGNRLTNIVVGLFGIAVGVFLLLQAVF